MYLDMKTKSIVIKVEESIMNEILALDNGKMFYVDDDIIVCKKPILKQDYIVQDNTVAYANSSIAISTNGKFLTSDSYNTILSADLEIHVTSQTVYKNRFIACKRRNIKSKQYHSNFRIWKKVSHDRRKHFKPAYEEIEKSFKRR